ncbi:hypothetical protein KNT62_gp217 [Escherichia phage phiC120]|uniref:Uncharacterized protein n=1 Tax=Escherichia phage phiC120 TaxID=1970776 RepID=A0A1W6JUH1_9CAUD|nr:hypothetical protein KNT62_gp217 [Escherichia phage phiC120]ARM70924.1 hypothetical protein phiC120_c219 [Escherichia phage phiC120]
MALRAIAVMAMLGFLQQQLLLLALHMLTRTLITLWNQGLKTYILCSKFKMLRILKNFISIWQSITKIAPVMMHLNVMNKA